MGKILYPGYFTNCIPIETPTKHLSNYLQFNLQEAMAFFWRVRSWRIQIIGSASKIIQEDPEIRETITYSGGTAQLSSLVDSEEQLVCFDGRFNYPIYSLLGQRTIPDGSSSITIDNDYDYYFSYYNDDLYAIKNENTFYMPVRIAGQGAWLLYTNIYYEDAYPPAATTGQYTISFNGIIKTGTVYAYYFAEEEYSGNLSINITADSYWSYGGTYDTATGEPL